MANEGVGSNVSVEEEAKALGVKKSKVSMGGYKEKKADKIDKEKAKHDRLCADRLKKRVEKAKARAKLKPIDKRKIVLIGRLKAVKERKRTITYPPANIKAWIEELNMINQNPKSWNTQTKNGKVNYTPDNKRKKTTKDILDGMDLD